MSSAILPASVGLGADLEVRAERAGDLVGDEVLQRNPGRAANQLADQEAVVERLIARRRARLPPRRLRGEHRRGLLPVEEVVDGHRLLPAGHSGGVRQQVPHLDVLLAVGGELRPIGGDRTRRGRAAPGRRASAPARLVTVLVDDQTLTIVSSRHGTVFAASAWPPQMSTTDSPSMSTAIAAPTSAPLAISSRERVGDLVESGVHMSVHGGSHACKLRPPQCAGRHQLS